jgi:ferredoxin-NADP reductase
LALQFPLRLVGSRMLAPSVRHLVFRRVDDAPMPYLAGQFLQVHFQYPDGTATKRSYSLANPPDPNADGALEIAVSYVAGGAATALFAALEEGDEIVASGPYGRFCLMPDDANRRYLLIGTGTGVTPYRSMLPQLAQQIRDRGIEVLLLFGARSPQEMLYAAEFCAFAEANSGFRFLACHSRELPRSARPDDRSGYVQQVLEEFDPHPERDIAYLCGNPDMVDACFERLTLAGLPIRQIRREKYVSSR